MPKQRRDKLGRFASTGGGSTSGKRPQGKGSPSGSSLNGKPMTVGAERAFTRSAIARGSMTKDQLRAAKRQAKETGQEIAYRTELGRQRRPSSINRTKLGNGWVASTSYPKRGKKKG